MDQGDMQDSEGFYLDKILTFSPKLDAAPWRLRAINVCLPKEARHMGIKQFESKLTLE